MRNKMRVFEGLQFETFREDDVEPFTGIMKRAFDEDTRRHLDEPSGGPDGYDTGEFLRKWALHPDSHAFTISKDNMPIGAAIVWINRNRENYLGTMFIEPGLQDKGWGTIVWKFIETEYPDTIIWRTDTPGFSKRNHHFYVNKCGFKIVRINHPGDRLEESYLMEKRVGG